MRFFSQNFGTIKRILPRSSSPSHRKGSGIEVGGVDGSVGVLLRVRHPCDVGITFRALVSIHQTDRCNSIPRNIIGNPFGFSSFLVSKYEFHCVNINEYLK